MLRGKHGGFMAKFWKIVLSTLVVLVAMLVAAAGTELTFGEHRSGFVPMIVWLIAGPILYLIWRKRAGGGNA